MLRTESVPQSKHYTSPLKDEIVNAVYGNKCRSLESYKIHKKYVICCRTTEDEVCF